MKTKISNKKEELRKILSKNRQAIKKKLKMHLR